MILGELLLTKTGESYKIVTPAFSLPALIDVFKSMYRMHGYCVGRLNFCMSTSQTIDHLNWSVAKYGDLLSALFFVVILGELLLTKTGESYKIVTPAFTLPALIVGIQVYVQNARLLCWQKIFLHEYVNYRPPWINKSQNMAICYIHFFSVVILGELLLTKTEESYKIVTPAFTLPALIVVSKSMYRMHGYCVGRLNFARVCHNYRPLWIDQFAK